MALINMLDGLCDVYHINRQSRPAGYGVGDTPAFSYGDDPDISGLPCHFGTGTYCSHVVKAGEPRTMYVVRIKMTISAQADIRLNDRIINRADGLEYTAEVPVLIRGRHKYVYLYRPAEGGAL